MASRSQRKSQATGDSDSLEVLKPLLVLALFGTILYGAYSIVQKGPQRSGTASEDAPSFAPPQVEFTSLPASSSPTVADPPAAFPSAPPGAANTQAAALPASVTPSAPGARSPIPVPAPVSADTTATFLPAQSAPPPVSEPSPARPSEETLRPDRFAALPNGTTPPGLLAGSAESAPAAVVTSDPTLPLAPSAAFTSAWSDAHEKLAAGRYAEALASLSIWHDDPALGLEESQRLEDLLGQLAGTVIYSQRDLLLPGHLVSPGETLPAIATALAVPWQLLAKINGIDDPQTLYPGEHLKLVRGPFDATVSVSRRRLTLHVGGNYAGRFTVVVGRQLLDRVGSSLAVREVVHGAGADPAGTTRARGIILDDGIVIEAADDPAALADTVAPSSVVVSERDLAELLDILGPGSRVLVRQ
jgi:hypothetical protein